MDFYFLLIYFTYILGFLLFKKYKIFSSMYIYVVKSGICIVPNETGDFI